MQLSDRPLPHDCDAERHVLGACLLEPEAILVVRDLVSMADFSLERHACIYQAILECVARRVPPEISLVADQLRQAGQLELVGGLYYLGELAAGVPTAVYADHYARIVKRLAARRRLIQLGAQLAVEGYSDDRDPDAVLKEMQLQLQLERRIIAGDGGWEEGTRDGRRRWGEEYPPMPFVVDTLLPQGCMLLVGKPKTRKSWLALNLCYAVASGGKALGHFQAMKGGALYIDLEMGDRRIHKRLRAVFPAEPPPKGVQFATEWPVVGAGFEDWLADYLEKQPYTRLVVVDTLVHIRPPRSKALEPYEQDKEFAQRLTNFCQGRGIALLLIHHARKMEGSTPIDDASGTSGLTGGVDNVAVLKRTEDSSEGTLDLIGRDIERDDKLNLKWDPHLVNWCYQEQRPATQITPERRKVLALLQESPGLTGKEIALLLRRDEPGTRRLLSDMLKARLLQNAQGAWFVTDDEAESVVSA